MPWPIPPEGAIADRFRRGFEQAFGTAPDGTPLAETVDTSPGTPYGVIAETADETHTELYLYQQSLSLELMPDTATALDDGWLPRHGNEWGVPQLLPSTALGNLIFTGTPGAALPAGIEVSDPTAAGGQVWRTSGPAVIPPNPGSVTGSVSIPAEAETAGNAGNRPAGTVLTLVSAVAGLTVASATVDASGLAGGTDIEDPERWRARILARIRTPGAAGTTADYRQWAANAGAAYVQVVPEIVGAGSVGVYVGMAGPAAPTPDQLARIDAAIQVARPVTAVVLTLGATLLPVPVTLLLSPDTVTTRAAATLGVQAFFLLEGRPGQVLPAQRLSDAIAASSGEYTHVLVAPAADVAPLAGQIPVPGAIGFGDGSALPPPPPGWTASGGVA